MGRVMIGVLAGAFGCGGPTPKSEGKRGVPSFREPEPTARVDKLRAEICNDVELGRHVDAAVIDVVGSTAHVRDDVLAAADEKGLYTLGAWVALCIKRADQAALANANGERVGLWTIDGGYSRE